MSLPTFPEIPEELTVDDSISRILTSIAMEEVGLSHIINAEGEKLQYILGTLPGSGSPAPTIEELLEINESVKDMLGVISANQMFLYGKMSAALNVYMKSKSGGGGNGGCPENPLGVIITADKGSTLGNYIYLQQGESAELNAIVITSGNTKVNWTHDSSFNFSFTVNGNKTGVKISQSAPIGSSIIVKASSAANSARFDSKMIVVIDAAAKSVTRGGDGNLYTDYGDNTFKKITAGGIVLSDFICGGFDMTPGTEDDRHDVIVSESGVKYLGPNADDSYQKAGADKLLGTEDDVLIWLIDGTKPINPCNGTETPPAIQDKPTVATGRTLGTDKTGDNAVWVEIARNGGYSLIVREKYINTNSGFNVRDNPLFQYSEFGPDEDYKNSYVRQKINLWFEGNAYGDADNLDKSAPLRGYTVKNTAVYEPGTGAAGEEGVNDGFSSPTNEYGSQEADVAFALSYGEAVNFVSKAYAWGSGGYHDSNLAAAANFEKLQIPGDNVSYNKTWLRSPGGLSDVASALYYDGKVFRTFINGTNNEYCLIQPALWVASTIFN